MLEATLPTVVGHPLRLRTPLTCTAMPPARETAPPSSWTSALRWGIEAQALRSHRRQTLLASTDVGGADKRPSGCVPRLLSRPPQYSRARFSRSIWQALPGMQRSSATSCRDSFVLPPGRATGDSALGNDVASILPQPSHVPLGCRLTRDRSVRKGHRRSSDNGEPLAMWYRRAAVGLLLSLQI